MKKWALCLILVFLLCGCQNGDRIDGQWQSTDGVQLVLNQQQFSYRQVVGDEVQDLSGSYEVYFGNKAIDYIAEKLPQFELTVEAQEEMLGNGQNHAKGNYLCLMLKPYAQEEGSAAETLYYHGFLIDEDSTLDLIKLNNKTYQAFARVPEESRR